MKARKYFEVFSWKKSYLYIFIVTEAVRILKKSTSWRATYQKQKWKIKTWRRLPCRTLIYIIYTNAFIPSLTCWFGLHDDFAECKKLNLGFQIYLLKCIFHVFEKGTAHQSIYLLKQNKKAKSAIPYLPQNTVGLSQGQIWSFKNIGRLWTILVSVWWRPRNLPPSCWVNAVIVNIDNV